MRKDSSGPLDECLYMEMLLLLYSEYLLLPFSSLIVDSCFADNMDLSTMDRGQLTLIGAAGCVMLSMHFTVQLISQHLFYWKNPKEQKAIIIIILMAPIYAANSFVGLLDIQGSKAFFMLLESIKECYEALVSGFHQCMIGYHWASFIVHSSACS